jgi:Tfp pilus assembly PilM family ATPase
MPWGLEFAPDRIRLCRADAHRGRIRLRGAAEAPVPAGHVQPSPKDGNLKDSAATTQTLRDVSRRVGCRGWVRLALPDPVFILRTIATDDLPEDRMAARRFLGWQVRDLLPFPSEEARLDYIQGGRAADGRFRVTCLIAHDPVLAEYERALQAADLRAAIVDARSVALAQAASALLSFPSVALLTADGPRATLLILQDGRPRLWRILPVDGANDATGVRLIREVADSLAFFRETEEDVEAVHRMFVHGLEHRTAEIGSELARWLDLPVTTLDLTAVLASGAGPRSLADELTRWGAAVGAAVRPW